MERREVQCGSWGRFLTMNVQWDLVSKGVKRMPGSLCSATLQKNTDPFDTCGHRASTWKGLPHLAPSL